MHRTAARLLILSTVVATMAATNVALAQDSAPAAAPGGEQAHFDVLEFRVLGNTVLPQLDIEKAVYPHLGPNKSLQDVDGARASLEKAYKDAGYGTTLVDIPEQNVDSGIVRLQVTEGKLDRIRVEGARYVSAKDIRERLPEARQGEAPSLPVLQAQVNQYNLEAPGNRSIVPVLAPGRQPGTMDLTVRVDDHLPVSASLEVNNQYSADTTSLRASASLAYNNLFDHLDKVSIQYQTSPQDTSEVSLLALNYSRRLSPRGDTLSVYHIDSDNDVAALGTLSVLGAGKITGLTFEAPFINTAASSHTFKLGAEYKDFKENIRLDEANEVGTPISYTNLSFSLVDVWRGQKFDLSLDNALNFGPRGLANHETEFADKRFKARANYFYLRSSATLNTPMFFKGWLLQTRLAGQYAVEPVISNEQFNIGGADGVRGYLEAEELDDIGAKIALQANSPPLKFGEDQLQLAGFAFYDAGIVSTLEPLPGESRNTDLRSAGAGISMVLYQKIDGSLAWAYPFVDGSRTAKGDSRLLFSVRASW
jgi:hemolysin activation/secretion protein